MWLPDKIVLSLGIFFATIFVMLITVGSFYKNPFGDVKVENPIHPVARLIIESAPAGHGSTVHIGDGYFLTSAHLLDSDDEVIHIQPQTYEGPIKADLLWASHHYDVALLYSQELSHIRSYEISCENLEVGEELEFHGNPQSQNHISTWGRVAGTERSVESLSWKEAIPVTGNIIPGMSGGSATNSENELVGINAAFLSHPTSHYTYSMTGISFIIPSSTICKLLNKS